MKFALVGPAHPYRGGIAQYNTQLFRALSAHHEVHLVSLRRQYPRFTVAGRDQREPNRTLMAPGVEALLDPLNPLSWRGLSKRLVSWDLDAVIFQWWQPFFAPVYAALAQQMRRRSRSKVLFLCHNVYPHEHLPFPGGLALERWIIRRVLRQGDGFLVHANELVGQVREFNRVAPVRRIFHPCYDFFRRWDKDSVEPRPTGSPKQLLFFGNIREYKGLDVFLRALAKIASRLDYRAVVAGEFFVDPEPYYRQCRDLGLDEKVIWRSGYVPDSEIPALFHSADLVVLPYKRATQSGVIPLAYEFGVPVVASNVGGLSEIVMHGKTGFLVPPDKPEDLAEFILACFREGRLSEFRAQIEVFKSRLSWHQVVDNILAILTEPVDEVSAKEPIQRPRGADGR